MNASNSDIGKAETLSRESARLGVLKITVLTLLSNIALAAIKGITGILAGSTALISDAVNSASDVFFGIVVVLGVRLAGKEADDKHPYGYERFESLVTMLIGVVVTLVGLFIGFDGIQKIWQGARYGLEAPDPAALWVAAGVIAFKSFMYLFTKARSKKYRSDVLAAAAADHGADALATFGVFIGIAAAQLGVPIADPIASLLIAVLVIKTGVEIIIGAVGQVTDKSAGTDTDEKIRSIALDRKEPVGVDKIMTRIFGDRIYVDIEICLPGDYTLDKAHSIAEQIHLDVEAGIPEVKDCMVHVNPSEACAAGKE
ncbi:MAG: cation diffusion facilitator family transporter [Coriobacteriia bacterium]|nr:cation diffusion facilitator family transporter [Coriobacteriia bacterium]MCL2745706.1 cation diffusion facilitator family transporter [Coriobacteriia bacterium]MCL2870247.1 cation diffusion facilitator family transporter [Coriobacteriia bacterium]